MSPSLKSCTFGVKLRDFSRCFLSLKAFQWWFCILNHVSCSTKCNSTAYYVLLLLIHTHTACIKSLIDCRFLWCSLAVRSSLRHQCFFKANCKQQWTKPLSKPSIKLFPWNPCINQFIIISLNCETIEIWFDWDLNCDLVTTLLLILYQL
jgi:hypothetical protein